MLEITSRGNDWLTADLDKQYEHIIGVLRATASPKSPGSSLGNHIAGIDLWDSYGRSDHRFLGSEVVVIKSPEKGQARPYWQTKPEDFQALREALYQGFQSLSIGKFYRLDSVLDHLVFDNHNPLLLGLDQRQISIYEYGRSIPPLAERREEVARRFLDTFIRKRLVPLGCLQAAIDETDSLLIARQPRLDAYFGRAVAAGEMAASSHTESRVVVQPDFSIVIIGLNPAPAAQLAPFCERTKRSSGSGALILKLTRESVVKAVAAGLKPAELVERLKRVASNEVPANVLRQVQDWCGWVRHARTSTGTIIRCTDPESADRVMAVLKRHAERLNETVIAVSAARLAPADRAKLRDQGIIIELRMTCLARPAMAPTSSSLNKNPHVGASDLGREAMHALASHGRAASVTQPEPPAVQRTDDLSFLDPSVSKESPRVGTTIRKRDHLVAGAKNGQAQAEDLHPPSTAIGNLIEPANVNPLGHATLRLGLRRIS